MHFKKTLSLSEVLVSVSIFVGVVIFVSQAFNISINITRLAQNIILGCLVAEDKLWEIEQKYIDKTLESNFLEGEIKLHNRKFKWKYNIEDTEIEDIKQLNLDISWEEKKKKYSIDFSTFLFKK